MAKPKPRAGTTVRRPNRAQRRAMEVRARATVASPIEAETPRVNAIPEERSTAAPRMVRPPRLNTPATSRRAKTSARPSAVSREQELRFIRMDLRRLAITAGLLLLMMISLLLVIE